MIRFLHTADWQLGKPFGQFPNELAGRLSAARIDVIARIAAHASAHAIGHVIVAGDVWDSEQPSADAIVQPMEIMGGTPGVTWWLMPGNHDPARPHGLWARLNPPANVRLLTTPEPQEMQAGVWLLPAPWTSRNPGRDLSADFDAMPTPDGAVRIGVAHGSTADFKGEAQSAVIAPDRAASARLDYLALGDWHGTVQVDDRSWYSGTPEPDRFPRNAPGAVLDVTLVPGASPDVRRVEMQEYRWVRLTHELLPEEDAGEVLGAAIAGRPARRTLLRTQLSGALPRAQIARLEAQMRDLDGRLAHLRRRDDLRTLWETEDLDGLDLSGSVRAAAETLRADETPVSKMALSLLFDIARETDGPEGGT